MNVSYIVIAIFGMGVMTTVTRGFFLLSDREWPLPPWAIEGLRYAPLATLTAVIAPEILVSDGRLIDTWRDAHLCAVVVSTAFFVWRRSILVTIVSGTVTMLALRIGLGW